MTRDDGGTARVNLLSCLGGAIKSMSNVDVLTAAERELKLKIIAKAERSGESDTAHVFLDDEDFDDSERMLIFGLADKHEVRIYRNDEGLSCVKARNPQGWLRILTANLAA